MVMITPEASQHLLQFFKKKEVLLLTWAQGKALFTVVADTTTHPRLPGTELPLHTPEADFKRFEAATIDLVTSGMGCRVEVTLPKEHASPLFEPLQRYIEAVINPALARHGGGARLDDLTEAGVARITLLGGCLGCPMAQVTLQQGIARQLQAEFPQITRVEESGRSESGSGR